MCSTVQHCASSRPCSFVQNSYLSSGNHFTDSVAKAFAESLKENRSLEELDLSYNEFGEVGGLFLGAGLVRLSHKMIGTSKYAYIVCLSLDNW